MKQAFVLGAWLAWSIGCLMAGEEGRGIPDVATLEALQQQEPHHLARGWDVRLGLSEPGEEAGPWKLLYCHVKHVAKGDPAALPHKGAAHGESLGPVFFTLEEKESAAGQVAVQGALPAEGLFCGLALCAWEGSYALRVVALDGSALAERKIQVGKPEPCLWTEFARWRRHQAEGQLACVACGEAFAARPDYSGLVSIWPPSGRVVKLSADPGETPLPGKIPLGETWTEFFKGDLSRNRKLGEQSYPLKLSLEGIAFVVRSGIRVLDWPDTQLLARWWVNGKPILPPRTDQPRMISIGRAVTYAREMRVAFGWPGHLGELKAGDKVGLQVLYSPAMVRQLPKTQAACQLMHALRLHEPDVASVPLLSNRIEFAVTPGLLEARASSAREE